MQNIGKKIKEIRKRKGLSQEELAEAAQVNTRTIQRIEKNESEARGSTLNLICKALEINQEDIFEYGKEEDKHYLFYLHLSVLSYLFFPLGNIILPLILWLNKRDKIIGLKEIGANVLNFQIVWTIVTFTSVLIFAFMKIMHYPGSSYFWYLWLLLYFINFVVPIYFAFSIKKDLKLKYPVPIQIIK